MRPGSTSGCSLEDVEAAPQVPDVLGQRVPPRHDGVHQVGVAGVVVLGSSSPGARRSSADRAPARRSPGGPAGARSRRWACRCAPGRPPVTCRVRGRGRPGRRPRVRPRRGRRARAGRRAPTWCPRCRRRPCPGDSRRTGVDSSVSRLSGTGSGSGPSSSARTRRQRSSHGPNAVGVALGQGILVRGGGQAGHPLVPGRVVARRRGQDERPPRCHRSWRTLSSAGRCGGRPM